MKVSQIYDIIFIGLIIALIVLYIVFSKKNSSDIKTDKIIDVDDIIIHNEVQNDISQQEETLQETHNVLLLEGDDYKYINTSDLPWDDNIDCESEEELDSLHALMLNNLHGRKREYVLY
jgi:uncharacterized membrane protein